MLTCARTEQHGPMHFPAYYLIATLVAAHATARNYPDWPTTDGQSHPRSPAEELNLSITHRHENRGNQEVNQNVNHSSNYKISYIDHQHLNNHKYTANNRDSDKNNYLAVPGHNTSYPNRHLNKNERGKGHSVHRNASDNLRRSGHSHNSSYGHRHIGVHRHGNRGVVGVGGGGNNTAKGVEGEMKGEMEKLMVVDATTGIQYNPYGKHQPG